MAYRFKRVWAKDEGLLSGQFSSCERPAEPDHNNGQSD
jgi:hypothetical protein